ncbi:hypothetical protein FRC11_014334 [Ceratobasidium sp. 423]|nr:hypothetical protein FRC11_014334 [Ceratobasidium sp. 423]
MVDENNSYIGGPPRITEPLAFFYLFELSGLLLAERFFPPTVVFEPLEPLPRRTIPREDIIVTELRPRSPLAKSGPCGYPGEAGASSYTAYDRNSHYPIQPSTKPRPEEGDQIPHSHSPRRVQGLRSSDTRWVDNAFKSPPILPSPLATIRRK